MEAVRPLTAAAAPGGKHLAGPEEARKKRDEPGARTTRDPARRRGEPPGERVLLRRGCHD